MAEGNAEAEVPAAATEVFICCAPADDTLAAEVSLLIEEHTGLVVQRHRHRVVTARYRTATLRALEVAQVVVVLWTATSRRSAWLMDEADVAMRRGVLVAVDVGRAMGPLGHAGAVRIRLRSRKGRMLASDAERLVEVVGRIAEAYEGKTAPGGWRDRSVVAAFVAHGFDWLAVATVTLGFLVLAPGRSVDASVALFFSSLALCEVLASAVLAYVADATVQRLHLAAAHDFGRRLLARWFGQLIGGSLGPLVWELVLTAWTSGQTRLLFGVGERLFLWFLFVLGISGRFFILVLSPGLRWQLMARRHFFGRHQILLLPKQTK